MMEEEERSGEVGDLVEEEEMNGGLKMWWRRRMK